MSALVLDGHPNASSFCAAIARTYQEAHGDADLLAVRELGFDVHMRWGYSRRMEIEPDLAEARAAVREADHLVVVTPVWWRSVPALLKGFLDRALLPREDYRFTGRGLPEGLLTGRTGRVLATADTPAALSWLMPDTRLSALRRGTLAFCGIRPVPLTYLAPIRSSTPERRERWLDEVAEVARADASRAPAQSSKSTSSVLR